MLESEASNYSWTSNWKQSSPILQLVISGLLSVFLVLEYLIWGMKGNSYQLNVFLSFQLGYFDLKSSCYVPPFLVLVLESVWPTNYRKIFNWGLEPWEPVSNYVTFELSLAWVIWFEEQKLPIERFSFQFKIVVVCCIRPFSVLVLEMLESGAILLAVASLRSAAACLSESRRCYSNPENRAGMLIRPFSALVL